MNIHLESLELRLREISRHELALREVGCEPARLLTAFREALLPPQPFCGAPAGFDMPRTLVLGGSLTSGFTQQGSSCRVGRYQRVSPGQVTGSNREQNLNL